MKAVDPVFADLLCGLLRELAASRSFLVVYLVTRVALHSSSLASVQSGAASLALSAMAHCALQVQHEAAAQHEQIARHTDYHIAPRPHTNKTWSPTQLTVCCASKEGRRVEQMVH